MERTGGMPLPLPVAQGFRFTEISFLPENERVSKRCQRSREEKNHEPRRDILRYTKQNLESKLPEGLAMLRYLNMFVLIGIALIGISIIGFATGNTFLTEPGQAVNPYGALIYLGTGI